MWKVTFAARGVQQVVKAMRELKATVERATGNVPLMILEQAVERLTSYPPPNEGNRPPPPYWARGEGYVRRGGGINPISEEYGGPAPFGNESSWNIRRLSGGEWAAETKVSYAPFLVSDYYQSYIHSGRWKTVEDVLIDMGIDGTEIGGEVSGWFNDSLRKIVDELSDQGKFNPNIM